MQEILSIAQRLAASEQPIFYINRPSIHLLGVERWVPNLYSIRMRDIWNSNDPRVFAPSKHPITNLSHEASVHWLLMNAEVREFIASRTPSGMRPKVVVFMHDQRTEDLCAELGYDIMAIPVAERLRLDSKLLTTTLSEQAGLRNVPHVLTEVSSYPELLAVASDADLGTELVVQTDYGEAGAGTYFIKSEADFTEVAEHLLGKTLKIMKRITHRSLAMEAVVTNQGIIAGPLQQDIIGHPEVAIHRGSSSGLEYYADVLPPEQRKQAMDMVLRYGEVLRAEGYLGLYEVDILHDTDTDTLYFGEANPRFSGCAMVSNATTAEFWGLPFYALHLYAFLDFPDPIDVDAINASWDDVPQHIAWSNLLLRHTSREPEEIITAPKSGRYRRATVGALEYVQHEYDWFDLRDPSEVFFLSYRSDGDTKIYGSDIGSLYRHGRFQDYAGDLTPESKQLIAGIHALFTTKPLSFATRAKNSLARRASNAWARLRSRVG